MFRHSAPCPDRQGKERNNMRRNKAGSKGNTNLFHFVTFHYIKRKVICFTQTAFFYHDKTDFNLFTCLKIAKEMVEIFLRVIFTLKTKTFFYNQIVQWCPWNTLRSKKYHLTSYLILQDLWSSFHLQGPWDSDIMPLIICVLQLKLLFTPSHAIQCLNSREIAGTCVNIVAGVGGGHLKIHLQATGVYEKHHEGRCFPRILLMILTTKPLPSM